MTLDFTPAARAASAPARVWAHAKTEASLILRNGEQAILAVVIPLAVLVGSRLIGDRLGLDIQQMAPSVLALVMWSSCLTTLAIGTGFERRYNVLERVAATPLGKTGILLGKGLSIAMITIGQVIVLTIAALALGWRPSFTIGTFLFAVLVSLLSMAAFAGLALVISGSLRPEATLALANLLYIVGMPLGILVPATAYPDPAQIAINLLPTGALGGALRATAEGDVYWFPAVVAAVWCLLMIALARRVFRWTS